MSKLTVVGGTYREICLSPKWNEIYGSGLRAASCLGRLCETTFVTRVEPISQQRVKFHSQTHSFSLAVALRDDPVSFQYDHSLSRPKVYPDIRDLGKVERIEVEADQVLGFSFIEDTKSNTKVTARRLVFDPQAGRSAKMPSVSGYFAQEIVVVCNSEEAKALLGKSPNSISELASEIQRSLIGEENTTGFVVKCGPSGALVITKHAVESVPFFHTERVFPIGSGDIFSAWLTFELFVKDNNLFIAARNASAATSIYCEHRLLPKPKAVERRLREGKLSEISNEKRPQVYLAGGFFSISELWLLNEAKRCLTEMNCDYFSPMDEIGLLNDGIPPKVIVEGDLNGLKQSNVVLALLDTMDPGTIFEIGYAVALGKPVVCFVQNKSGESMTMIKGSELCSIHDDLASAIYRVASLGWKT